MVTAMGIFTTDAALRVRSWDDWLAQITGILPEAAYGQHISQIIPDLVERRLLARFERVLSDGVVEVLAPAFHHYLIAVPPQTASSRFREMQQSVTISPLRAEEQIVGVMVKIEDVTGRIDYERDLAQQLASPDENVRLQAAKALALQGDSMTLPANPVGQSLFDALGDSSWRVRRVVVDTLGQQRNHDMVSQLLRTLRREHRDLTVLNSALQTLALTNLDVVQPLIDFLQDADVELRMYAALALSNQPDTRAVAALLGALQDEDINVRYHVIDALGKLQAVEAAPQLVAIAESEEFFLAFPALDALRSIGDRTVAPRIVPLLQSETLHEPAIDALGQLGDEAVVAPLAELLPRPGAAVTAVAMALVAIHERYEAQYSEGRIIADRAGQAISLAGARQIIAALDRESDELKLRALVTVLGWLEGEAVENVLTQRLADQSTRREVVQALVCHGRRATPLLVEQLQSANMEARQAAVVALGQIGDPEATPALSQLLGAADNDLTIMTAGALAKIGDQRAFEPLLALLDHPGAAVRQAAISAVNSLGHPDMPARAQALLRDPNPHLRESAVKIAGYFGFRECADLLLAAAHDPDENVRRAAIEHLPYLDDARALPLLRQALQQGSPPVRAAAARAYALLDGADVAADLQAALGDEDAWVRYFALRTISRIGLTEALDTVAEMAHHDPAGQARSAAIEALAHLDGERVVAVLTPLLDQEDDDIAGAALRALGYVNDPAVRPLLLHALRTTTGRRKIEAIHALGRQGGEGVAGALQWVVATAPLIDDEMAPEGREAVAALLALDSPEATAALINLTADRLRRGAVLPALMQLPASHLDAVARGLRHPHPGVRGATIQVLASFKRSPATAAIVTALNDSEPAVRIEAIIALGQIGSAHAGRQLAQMAANDSNPAARRAAQQALKG